MRAAVSVLSASAWDAFGMSLLCTLSKLKVVLPME